MTSPDERIAKLLQEARRQLELERSRRTEPIAIVGIGCRFPAAATSPAALWRVLCDGVDASREVPAERWDANAFYDPDPEVPGRAYTRRASFLEQVEEFDAAFFGISPREAAGMDPQQRLLLEIAWEAIEDAGIPLERLRGSRTGVWVGSCVDDYARISLPPGDTAGIDAYNTLGSARSIAAGRISYVFDLHGPTVHIDTACSSSLVGVHQACQSLRARECDWALAGGVNLMLAPESTIALCKLRALAPDGRCKTFDASADGYGRGEGCGVVMLSRLSDALAAGLRIYAVIRGSACNHDGHSNGLTAPSGLAQEAVIRAALANGDVAANSVGYVEAHGTGTLLGDPIEVMALQRAYRQESGAPDPLWIGALKTNFGHLEGAAGIASLIKAALSVHHGKIPPHLHLREPNPKIPWAELPMRIPRELQDWPRGDAPRRAGVSSFGISGTNAHIVLEEPPVLSPPAPSAVRSAELVVLSAYSPDALPHMALRLRAFLEANPDLTLGDVARALVVHRSSLDYRLALAAPTRKALLEALAEVSGRTPSLTVGAGAPGGKTVFTFPGQGSQWLGMGRTLLQEEPAFREALLECDRAIRAESAWSVLAELEAPPERSRLQRIDVVQPVLFAFQVALAALWRAWGVEPDLVVGHSMGEVAAACVAGALPLQHGAAIICRRSQLLSRISGQGEMALVELSLEEAQAELRGLEDRLSVAVTNGSRATVVSGDPAAMSSLAARLEAKGIFCRRIKVDVASHSPQVDPLLPELRARLADVHSRPGTLGMLSTVTGELCDGIDLNGQYWADNLRRPVLFSRAIQKLLPLGYSQFVEISPHPLLVTSVEQLRAEAKVPGIAVGSLRRELPERLTLLESLGALHVQGHQLDASRLFTNSGPHVDLPTYAWQRQRYWAKTARGLGAGSAADVLQALHRLASQGELSPSARAALPEIIGALSEAGEPAPEQPAAAAARGSSPVPGPAVRWEEERPDVVTEREPYLVRLITAEVMRVLGVASAAVIKEDTPLVVLGMDSLMALELRLSIGRRLSLPTSFWLSVDPTLATTSSIARELLPVLEGRVSMDLKPLDLPAAAALEGGIRARPQPLVSVNPSAVLLTGATGFLGAFLLSELLRQTPAKISCLVRAKTPAEGLQRVEANLRFYGLSTASLRDRVSIHLGDISQPWLGLAERDFHALAESVDAIYNNAAHVSYVAGYDDMKGSHVDATRQMLWLAAEGRPKAIHHISSIAVYDSLEYSGRTVSETTPPSDWQGLYLPYSQCKWVSEAMVREAAERGVPATVHRPCFIGGASDGAWNTTDLTCRLIKGGLIDVGCYPADMPVLLDIAPVDCLARAIVHLSGQSTSLGKTFHLQHPVGIVLDELVEILRSFGYSLEPVAYDRWLARLWKHKSGALYPLMLFLTHRWAPYHLTPLELYRARPILDNRATMAELAKAGIEYPPLDRRLLHRYLAKLAAMGFVPEPEALSA